MSEAASDNVTEFQPNETEEDGKGENGSASSGSGETKDVGGVAGARLSSFIERIERLEEDKKGIADDIKEIYAEAKGNGYDVKALRKIVSLRKMEVSERHEQEMVLDTYMRALGMLPELDEVEAA